MKTKLLVAPLTTLMFLSFARLVAAHAVVKPSQVGEGTFQTFTLGVPSEKAVATIGIRLVLPDGLNYVTPNVKPGWKVEIKKQTTGKQVKNDDGIMAAEEKITEIDWSAGSIPSEQRDEFVFSAQVPPTMTSLPWKVYQTYADNSVLSWDQDPKAAQPKDSQGNFDFSKVGPYSQTQVVNDLAAPTAANVSNTEKKQSNETTISLALSVVALVLAASAWRRQPIQKQ